MALLPACNNTFEITHGRFPHCADIEVNKKKYDDQESKYYMELISQKNTAESQELFENKLREHKGPAGYEQERYYHVHHAHIGNLLKGIELALSVYGKRGFFTFKVTVGIKIALLK